MSNLNRRGWIKSLTTAGAGALLLSPSDILAAMSDYEIPATERKIIRLSSNENPYSPSPLMKQTIANIDPDLCRYPNMHFGKLEAQIAAREGVHPEEVVITSGSREGLKAVGMMYSLKGGEIVSCLPTYKALIDYAEFIGSKIRAVPLDKNLGFNLTGISAAINDKTKLIFICNPNNPTGTLLDPNDLEKFCRIEAQKVPIFIDEVYYDYIDSKGYPSMKKLISKGLDIIIARTFSKVYGLAGVRIGYMIAKKETAAIIRKSLMSGTNIMGLRLAQTSLEDAEFYNYSLRQNQIAKELIYAGLKDVGLKYIPSHANFVFFETERDIASVQKSFLKLGVAVGRAFPPYMTWCRISTGTLEEVNIFVGALKQVFRS